MAAKMTALRMPEELHAKLGALAEAQDRSINYLINSAVKRMIEDNEEMLAIVDEGLAQLAAGQSVSHEEVMAEGDAIIQAAMDRARLK